MDQIRAPIAMHFAMDEIISSRELHWPKDRDACFEIWRQVGWIEGKEHHDAAEAGFSSDESQKS